MQGIERDGDPGFRKSLSSLFATLFFEVFCKILPDMELQNCLSIPPLSVDNDLDIYKLNASFVIRVVFSSLPNRVDNSVFSVNDQPGGRHSDSEGEPQLPEDADPPRTTSQPKKRRSFSELRLRAALDRTLAIVI